MALSSYKVERRGKEQSTVWKEEKDRDQGERHREREQQKGRKEKLEEVDGGSVDGLVEGQIQEARVSPWSQKDLR